MKNSTLFIKLTCIIPALVILCMVNLKAQGELIGYTYLGQVPSQPYSIPHFYYLSNCETTWEEANEAATEMGGYLATLTNWYESGIVGAMVEDLVGWGDDEVNGAWIGLRGENGDFKWANGELYSFNQWGNICNMGEPVYADGAALTGNSVFYEQCSNDHGWWTTYPVTGEAEYIVEFSTLPNCNSANKSYVCHNGNTICVNNSAVQAHLNHGDLAGPCGPCNTYASMQAPPDETSEIAGHSLQIQTGILSNPKEQQDIAYEISSTDQVWVFPNPASDEIHVLIPGINQEGILTILSLTGQKIHTQSLHVQQSIMIDLSNYAAGIYLIDIRCTQGHYQQKFVKL